jgi:hypothetical protein
MLVNGWEATVGVGSVKVRSWYQPATAEKLRSCRYHHVPYDLWFTCWRLGWLRYTYICIQVVVRLLVPVREIRTLRANIHETNVLAIYPRAMLPPSDGLIPRGCCWIRTPDL